MKQNVEFIFDTKANGGCGCNCGCSGANIVEEMNELAEELQNHSLGSKLNVSVLPISELNLESQIEKINLILESTSAAFRADKNNIENMLSDLLPIVTLDGKVITAYGVPTLYDVVLQIEKHANL